MKGGRRNNRRFEDGHSHTPAQSVHIDQWEVCCDNSSHGTSADNYRGEDIGDHTDYPDISIPIYYTRLAISNYLTKQYLHY